MKILIVSYYYPPIASVASERIYSFAQYLSEIGHEVEVLTTTTPQPLEKEYILASVSVHRIRSPLLAFIENKFGFLRRNGSGKTQREEKTGFFRAIFRKLNSFRIRRGLGYLGRMPDVTDLWFLSCRQWIKKQPGWDVVISSYAPYASHLGANYAKRKAKCSLWVADFRDLWTDHHIFYGLFPFTLFERLLEKYVCENSDLVTVATRGMAKNLGAKYSITNLSVIYNGYRHSKYSETFVKYRKQTPSISIMYCGTLYPEIQNPEPIFQSISRLLGSHPQLARRLNLSFLSGMNEYLKKRVAFHGIEEIVTYQDWVLHDEMMNQLLCADYLLLIDTAKEFNNVTVPAKLFDYIGVQRPILFLKVLDESESLCIALETNCTTVINNDPDDIYRFLKNDIQPFDPENIRPSENVIARFSRREQCNKLNSLLSKLKNA